MPRAHFVPTRASTLHLALCCASLAACGASGDPPGRTLEVAIAPLALPNIGEACYDLAIHNGPGATGELVWARGEPGHQTGDALVGDSDAVCSGRFGNAAGGSIAYVGPCDADGGQEGRLNSVTVWFDGLYAEGGAYIDPAGPDGWQDPCPTGCTLDVLCQENEDSRAEFSFTVMRDAQQGFFDIAVDFEDIFCAGKYDTCYDVGVAGVGDRWIELLFGDDASSAMPLDGPGRDRTGVLALACGVGADSAATSTSPAVDRNTRLRYSQVTLSCTGPAAATLLFMLPLDVDAGQHDITVDWGGDIGVRPFQYATYFGKQLTSCLPGQPGSCNLAYLNVAMNIEDIPVAWDCSLSAQATATEGVGPLVGGVLSGAGSSYPFVDYAISHVAACQQNPINGDGSEVGTTYASTFVGGESVLPMCYSYDGGASAPVSLGAAALTVDDYATHPAARSTTGAVGLATFGDWDGYLRKLSSPCGGISGVRDLINIDVLVFDGAVTGQRIEITPTPANFDLDPSVTVRLRLKQSIDGTSVTTFLVGNATAGVAWSDLPAFVDVPALATVGAGDSLELELVTPSAAVPSGYPAAGIDVAVRLGIAIAPVDECEPSAGFGLWAVYPSTNYAHNNEWRAVSIDPSTGNLTVVGSLGAWSGILSWPGQILVDAGRAKLHALGFDLNQAPHLYTLDLVTHSSSAVPVPIHTNSNALALLGTTDTGEILAFAWHGNIVVLDPMSGATTVIGNTGFDVVNPAFDQPRGILYSAASGVLSSYDLKNNTTSTVAVANLTGLTLGAVLANGHITAIHGYGASAAVVTIDPATGAVTARGGIAEHGAPLEVDPATGIAYSISGAFAGSVAHVDLASGDSGQSSLDQGQLFAARMVAGGCGFTQPPPDPCAACSANASCALDGETATCTCNIGYVGNGVNCQKDAICGPEIPDTVNCNGICVAAEVGTPDCNGICAGFSEMGTPDCDNGCDAGETGFPDCDGSCSQGEQDSNDCDSLCGLNDRPNSLDCNGVCQTGEALGPDCNSRCALGEEGTTDCDGQCSSLETAGTADCDGVCEPGDSGIGPDCNQMCNAGEAGSPDCNGVCNAPPEFTTGDCNGVCGGMNEAFTPDCDQLCEPGDVAPDCDGACVAGEEGSIDCP